MNTPSASVPLADAKSKLSELVDRVIHGEEFTITRHNVEVARLIPVRRFSRREVSAEIAKMRATRSERLTSIAELLEWRNEGRK